MEIEIKLTLPTGQDYRRLLALAPNAPPVTQTNHFFDDPSGILATHRMMLRLRVNDNQSAVLTLKCGKKQAGDAMVREEFEAAFLGDVGEIIERPSEILSVETTPIEHLVGRLPGLTELGYVGNFCNWRSLVPIKIGEREFVCEVDRTEYSDQRTEYELELELDPTDDIEAISSALRSHLASLDIRTEKQYLSKYERLTRDAR